MPAAVPEPNRVAHYIVQHPALARFHAGLVNAVTEHVIVVAHDYTTLRVCGLDDGVSHLALIAFDVECDTSRIAFFDDRILTLESIACDCQKGATQRIGTGYGWRSCVYRGLGRRIRFGGA